MTLRPNVVLVVLDTARADALEPYGAPAGSSPALADLGLRGSAAQHVFSTANWTFPSHVSMLSGRLPREAGLYRVGDDVVERMTALAPQLLPVVLHDAGYTTGAVSANPWIHPSRGFDLGFDEFIAVKGSHRHSGFNAGAGDERSWFRRTRTAAPRAADAIRARADHGAAEAADVIRRWVEDVDRSRPFFWFVNLLECHSPYAPPRRFARLGPLDRVRAAFDHEHVNGLLALWAINSGARTVAPERLERMRRAYPGGVLAADAWVADLLTALDGRGLLDDTLVVVTSDHGENLGEGGRVAHSLWLDDRLVRVPLVSAGPVALATESVTSLAALPRLVADAVGLTEHPWQRPTFAGGVGLAQFDPPVPLTDPRFDELRDQLALDDYAVWRLTTPSTCATDGTLKLVVEGDEEWVYDLAVDPDELSPMHVDGRSAAHYGDRLAVLRHAARSALPGREQQTVPSGNASQAAMAFGPTDDAMVERMRLLGYL